MCFDCVSVFVSVCFCVRMSVPVSVSVRVFVCTRVVYGLCAWACARVSGTGAWARASVYGRIDACVDIGAALLLAHCSNESK